jgi:anti-anti-sigma factor
MTCPVFGVHYTRCFVVGKIEGVFMPMPHDVMIFLCYAEDDRERVSRLYDDLLVEGFSPWMDHRDLLPGEIWEERIRKVIHEADFFLACLSRNAIDKSGFIQAEIKQALRLWEEKRDGDIYLIPIKLEDCQLPESLSNFHFATVFESDGFPRLVRAIQKGIEEKRSTHTIFERKVKEDHTSLGYLSKRNPFFEVSLSLLNQYKLENDYLPLIAKSLVEEFNWDENIIYRVLLIIREISINAFQYGCKGDINSKVTISARMEMIGLVSERIIIKIQSPGDGFDISQFITDEENRKLDDIRGLGLVTAKRSSDVFTYSKDGKTIQSIIIKNYERNIFRETKFMMDDIPIILISPSGRIDHSSADDFQRSAFSKAFEVFPDKSFPRGIIIDLKDVSYMSSVGLRVLVMLAFEFRMLLGKDRLDCTIPLVLNGPKPAIQDLLRIAHYDSIFPIYSSIEESKAHIRNYFRNK